MIRMGKSSRLIWVNQELFVFNTNNAECDQDIRVVSSVHIFYSTFVLQFPNSKCKLLAKTLALLILVNCLREAHPEHSVYHGRKASNQSNRPKVLLIIESDCFELHIYKTNQMKYMPIKDIYVQSCVMRFNGTESP